MSAAALQTVHFTQPLEVGLGVRRALWLGVETTPRGLYALQGQVVDLEIGGRWEHGMPRAKKKWHLRVPV